MDIKSLVAELVKLNYKNKINFIIRYLNDLSVEVNVLKHANCINIEVIFKGTEEKELLFLAHHDISTKTDEGANDNTSSVAVLLKIADFLSKNKPKNTVKLVFNDNEEILGALLNKTINNKQITTIIKASGSFSYFNEYKNKSNIYGIIILELSGVGDALYISDKSGNINTDFVLTENIARIAGKNSYNFVRLAIPASDIISTNLFKLPATVIGAMPHYQAEKLYETLKRKDLSYDLYPSVWKNMHTEDDNIFKINNRALIMVYNFCLDIIKEGL